MAASARKRLRRSHLRDGDTPFARLPWELQRFVLDFLRCHLCEVTLDNCQVVALAVEFQLQQNRLLCPAELWVMLEHDVVFD
ncbi:hypothetical protein [Dyella acidiphila]|uniref:Uncharacterized protein n=1 Tax=Dyella acidiphila TaxID=2775866 RepID=A0ABR9GE96_9GAMM|nr:hypothetical protein [Dyella acidiphila]MBE1162374.1 hypothetical protein [Dyella acidiphila]